MTDINETIAALNAIQPGQEVPYFEGYLVSACEGEQSQGRAEARYLRSTAMRLWTDGRAHLVQRRIGPNHAVYGAIGKGRGK